MPEKQYVGIDLHRRRSVVVRVDQQGDHLSAVRVANDPVEVMAAVAAAGFGGCLQLQWRENAKRRR